MSRLPLIVPISELRNQAARLIGSLQDSEDPIVITQHGRAAAVLVSPDAYERTQHDLEVLKSLFKSELDVQEGREFPSGEVMNKARAILDR